MKSTNHNRGRIIEAEKAGRLLSDLNGRDDWLVDYDDPARLLLYAADGPVVSARSPLQRIDLVPTRVFGRILFLDGVAQLAEKDEFIYHELLVHPAAALAPAGAPALIVGGGDGCAAREVLRHADIERVILVDLDETVIDFCRRHLADLNGGALDDPRLEVRAEDGKKYLARSGESFGLVIFDLTDAVEDTPARDLYLAETFALVRDRLLPGGLLVVQAGGLKLHANDDYMRAIGRELGRVFGRARPYGDWVPSFDSLWTFWLAAADGPPDEPEFRAGRVPAGLRHYDRTAHRRAFALPRSFLGPA